MPVLEASRTNSLTDKNLQQYFRAMVSDYERKDIGAAYYRHGLEDATLEIARRMLKDKVPPETIVKYTGLSEEQVRAL